MSRPPLTKKINCYTCGKESYKTAGHYNRAIKLKKKMFCSWQCFSESRRLHKSIVQKKEEKRLYDIQYRRENFERLRPKRAAYFKKIYALYPEKFKEIRKKIYHRHLGYLGTSKYKAYKKGYDKNLRAKGYGELFESHPILVELENEIRKRITKYERALRKGSFDKRMRRVRYGKVKRGYA